MLLEEECNVRGGFVLVGSAPHCYGTDSVTHLTIKISFVNHKSNYPPMVLRGMGVQSCVGCTRTRKRMDVFVNS